MASDVRQFTVTCPAGVPKTNAQFTFLGLPPRVVHRIDWKVPPGPMGSMGFLLSMDGVPMLPTPGVFLWITTDNKDGYWELADYPDSGSWQCTMYNTGAFPHSVQLTFHMDVPSRPLEVVPLIPAYELGPAPDLSKLGPPVKKRP